MTSLILFIIVSLYVYIQLKAEVNLVSFIKTEKILYISFLLTNGKTTFVFR